MENKKGRYWQTIDCDFEKFLNDFNLNKGAKLDYKSFEDWGMMNLAEKFEAKKKA